MVGQLNSVVVAIESKADARFVFEKVRSLIAGMDSPPTVHAVRVVYEGIADVKTRYVEKSRELKSLILQAAESELEDILDEHAQGIENLESMALWNAKMWEAIVHAAADAQADLIVKASQADGATPLIGRTPDDWNLLRHAQAPVLLVRPAAWSGGRRLMAAVDAFDEDHGDLSASVLQAASAVRALVGGESLSVVSAYPLFEPWIGELGALGSYESLQRNVEQDIRDEVARLADQLVLLLLGVEHGIEDGAHAAEQPAGGLGSGRSDDDRWNHQRRHG